MKKFLDYNPLTKTTSYLHSHGEEYVIETIQDAEDIIRFNESASHEFDKKDDWWFVGSIPLNLCLKWSQESNTRIFSKEWVVYAKKQIQLPDYRKLNQSRIKL